jgi:hypothetical protein
MEVFFLGSLSVERAIGGNVARKRHRTLISRRGRAWDHFEPPRLALVARCLEAVAAAPEGADDLQLQKFRAGRGAFAGGSRSATRDYFVKDRKGGSRTPPS